MWPMARRGHTNMGGQPGEPKLRVPREKFEAELEVRTAAGQELLDRQANDVPGIDQLRRDFLTWDEFNEQLLRIRFSLPNVADGYRRVTPVISRGVRDPSWDLEQIRRDIVRQQRRLTSIRDRLVLYEEDFVEGRPPRETPTRGNKIFVVHGHDGSRKAEVVEFLQRVTGTRPIVLHEQADIGRTIIEKFEDHAGQAGFAVVLLTGDDVGSADGTSSLNSRARQNVVFELGFFFGALGRNRVVALYENGVELPSDILGVLYKPLSENWQTALAKELRAANIEVDLNRGVI